MYLINRLITPKHAIQSVLTGLLAVALFGVVAGCAGAGSNGSGNGSGIEAPSAPSSLEGESRDGEIGLSWSEVDEADSYSVYRATESGVETSSDPLTSGLEDTNYVDTNAENGTTYYYRVTAMKTEGDEEAESDGSDEIEKTPFDDPPDRPE